MMFRRNFLRIAGAVAFALPALIRARATKPFSTASSLELSMSIAKSEMLINAPRKQVFAAFADKDTICKFWLDYSNGDLAPGAKVEWNFMVPGAKETLEVLGFERNERIKFKWSDGIVVNISFADHTSQSTRVSVEACGFAGADQTALAVNATEGFAIVLCDLKSLMETGISGGMVRDKAVLIAENRPDDA